MMESERAVLAKDNSLLKELLLRRMPEPGTYSTAVAGLGLVRREAINGAESCFCKPSIGVIVQGSKRALFGAETYEYGENQCVVAGVDMPSSFCVAGASSERPFLAVSLDLDPGLITRLAVEMPLPPACSGDPASASRKGNSRGMIIADLEPEVLHAFLRLVALLDRPERIPVLAPLILREIHSLLLLGPQGECLRRINTIGSQSNQIAHAITWLRDNYKEPLHVETLARRVHMATSTFHRHFKEMTSLSPLQFHKRLRLYEARRLMLSEHSDAAGASLAVGYESPTQFSREYKRLFGEPPHRDVMRLRA